MMVLTGGLWATISASSPSRSTRTQFEDMFNLVWPLPASGSAEILESLERVRAGMRARAP